MKSAVTFAQCCDKWGRNEEALSLHQRLVVRWCVRKRVLFALYSCTYIKFSGAYHSAICSYKLAIMLKCVQLLLQTSRAHLISAASQEHRHEMFGNDIELNRLADHWARSS